ncbi:hypothetical protein [Nocardioides pacificus]
MTPPAAAHAFLEAVRDAADGTPYVVTPTAAGFDVTLSIADARWFALFNRAGLKKVHLHHVQVQDDGSYTITDDARSVEWVAGVPRLAATGERTVGRVREIGAQKVWAFDDHGRFGPVVDFRFNSEEGRDLIVGVADHLGLRQRRGAAERIGLAFAVVGGVGALATVLLLVVAALLGKF